MLGGRRDGDTPRVPHNPHGFHLPEPFHGAHLSSLLLVIPDPPQAVPAPSVQSEMMKLEVMDALVRALHWGGERGKEGEGWRELKNYSGN